MAKSQIGRRRTAALRDGGPAYAERRNEIIAAGAEVFRERGFEACSLRDVAAKLGTDRASLYYYVANKNELFQLVTQRAVTDVVVAAEAVSGRDAAAEARLRDLIITTVAKYEEHYPYVFVYIQEDMVKLHSESLDEIWARNMLDLGSRYEDALKRILDDGIADGTLVVKHPQLAMNTIIGAVNWTHRWLKPGGKLSASEVGEDMAEILCSGFVQRGPT